MKQCWNWDPHQRPSFSEIVQTLRNAKQSQWTENVNNLWQQFTWQSFVGVSISNTLFMQNSPISYICISTQIRSSFCCSFSKGFYAKQQCKELILSEIVIHR
jgi:hypothetical protein